LTLSSFRSLPRKGHLDRAKRVVSYIYRFKYAKVRFRTHEPNFSDLVIPEYDWSSTAYGNVREAVPHDAPTPLRKPVVTVPYVDANLLHCLNTGRSVTGILHFLNGTPIDWYSKKMATVETATYGAEFGDNELVVKSAILPHAKLHKQHNAHRVREAIASGNYAFIHIQYPGRIILQTSSASIGVIRKYGICYVHCSWYQETQFTNLGNRIQSGNQENQTSNLMWRFVHEDRGVLAFRSEFSG
jgi:hypothetical protein